MRLARHDGEILDTGIVRQTKCMPQDEVIVLDIVLAGNPRADPGCLAIRLVRVLAAGEELLIAVLRDVDVVIAKLGSLRLGVFPFV